MASVFVVVIATTLIMCAGLALDGARFMGARRNAELVAASAARTGSQWLDEAALNQGLLELDAVPAVAATNDILAQQGYDAAHRDVTYLGGGVLRVRVTRDVPTIILRVMGVSAKTVSASAQTQLTSG